MKAEHRKELQTNVLADKLGRVLQNMRAGPSRGTAVLLVVAVLAVVLGLIWYYFWKSKEESTSRLWVRWNGITTPQELQNFADDKDIQGTPQSRLARFELARQKLLEGTRKLGSSIDRDPAITSIREAGKLYEELADQVTDNPLMQQQAMLGAAKAQEALSEWAKAKEAYKRLQDKYPNSTLGEYAQDQLKRLSDESRTRDLTDLANHYGPSAGPR